MIETVRIHDADFEGGIIINKDQFDEKTMNLYVEPGKTELEPKVKHPVPTASEQEKKSADGDASDDDHEDTADDTQPTLPKLMKMNKDVLIGLAKEKGLAYPSPDEVTKETIANAILDAK